MPARGTTISRTELISHTRARLAPHKVPDRVRITTDMPLTPEGKVRKYQLLERARSELRKGRPENGFDDLEKRYV